MARRVALLGMIAVLACRGLAAQAPANAREEALEALEARTGELVNRDRVENKLPPLTYHKGLAAVARAHSQDMKDHGFFAHESPTTGKVKDRVAAAGLANRMVGENLARSATVESCETNLMHSPPHKENILGRDFTHVGVGLVRGDDGLLVCTQVFMQAPPVYDVGEVHKQVVAGINAARLAKGLRRLLPDETLARQALAHSERADRLGKFDPLWLEDELRCRDKRWRLHAAVYFLTDSPDEVVKCDTAMSESFDHFGVGVVQSLPTSKAGGALWITLICGQKK